jgi:hypothetical protein
MGIDSSGNNMTKDPRYDGLGVNDYAFCGSCETFFDFWKYADLVDAGHETCEGVRNVTPEELKGCIDDCEEVHINCLTCGEWDIKKEEHQEKGHEIEAYSCMTESFFAGPYSHPSLEDMRKAKIAEGNTMLTDGSGNR